MDGGYMTATVVMGGMLIPPSIITVTKNVLYHQQVHLYMPTQWNFPTYVPFPKANTDTYLRQAVTYMLVMLQDPKTNLPSLKFVNNTTNAYITLVKLLQGATTIQPTNPVPSPKVQNTILPQTLTTNITLQSTSTSHPAPSLRVQDTHTPAPSIRV